MEEMGRAKKFYFERNQMDKFRELRENCKTNYRKRTGSGLYINKMPFTPYEDEEILKQEVSDIELSAKLRRSATSIQNRRWRLKKGLVNKYIKD